jgi:hypothetical protein
MNAFRKIRLFVLLGFVAVLAISLSAVPAEAGHHNHHFHKFHHFHYPKFFNHGYYPTFYQPIVKYVVKPISYPVTQYDCYGQPYVVWQTTYQTVPTTYYP